jgi:hypothetical protein
LWPVKKAVVFPGPLDFGLLGTIEKTKDYIVLRDGSLALFKRNGQTAASNERL